MHLSMQGEPNSIRERDLDTSDTITEKSIDFLDEDGPAGSPDLSIGGKAPPRNRDNQMDLPNGISTKKPMNKIYILEKTQNKPISSISNKSKKRSRSSRSDLRDNTLDQWNQTGSQDEPITVEDDDDLVKTPSKKYRKVQPLALAASVDADVSKKSLLNRMEQLEADLINANHRLDQEMAGIRYHLSEATTMLKHDLWRSDKRIAHHLLDESLDFVSTRLEHGFSRVRHDFQPLGRESGNILHELTMMWDEMSD